MNDILIEDKKVSGILLEKIGDIVLVGIGVNVVRTPGIAEFNGTSLEDLKIHVHMPEVLNTILDNFKTCYNNWREFGFTFNRNKWLENCKGLNDNILVKLSQQEVNGTFKTIDEQGKLIVETSNGSVKIDSGELFFT